MKNYFFNILFLLLLITGKAQTLHSTALFAFTITDYSVKLNDSTVIVQITFPTEKGLIQAGRPALLKANYRYGDSATIGTGKCNLIKGEFYYFGIRLSDKNRLPRAGDLLYILLDVKPIYQGQLYHLIQHGIYLQPVTGGEFYSFSFVFNGDQKQENRIIDSFVKDISYTGQEMFKQNDGQDRMITSGRFKDKKLFAAMQLVTNADVSDFLDYMIYRPLLYAGNNWKIAEIFATWMDGGAPTVIKNK